MKELAARTIEMIYSKDEKQNKIRKGCRDKGIFQILSGKPTYIHGDSRKRRRKRERRWRGKESTKHIEEIMAFSYLMKDMN